MSLIPNPFLLTTHYGQFLVCSSPRTWGGTHLHFCHALAGLSQVNSTGLAEVSRWSIRCHEEAPFRWPREWFEGLTEACPCGKGHVQMTAARSAAMVLSMAKRLVVILRAG